jgi:hypothetical protein
MLVAAMEVEPPQKKVTNSVPGSLLLSSSNIDRSVMAGVTGTLRRLTRFVIQLVILLLRDKPWAVLLHEARKMYHELFLAATICVQLWCSFITIE